MTSFLPKGHAAKRRPLRDGDIPEHLARSLDASADDLRNGRLEDTAEFLDGMQRRIDEYFARKSAAKAR